MDISDGLRMRGSIEIALHNIFTGEVISKHKENTVVTIGRRWVLQQLETVDQATAQTLSHIAVGTSTAAPATGDTALGSEVTRLAINSFVTTNLTSSTPSWQAHVSYATNLANTTLGEVGMFQSSSGGTLFARATFATINKTTSNTLSVTWTISN